MEFRILGPVEVWDGAQRLDLGGSKPRALLAALLVHANQVVSTDRLIDELWGEEPPPTARNLIQGYVSRLRQALHRTPTDREAPAQVLVTQPPGYLLRVEPGQLDLHRFEALVAEARQAMADHDLERAAAGFRTALALWRGPALGDVDSEALRRTAVAHYEEARLVALEERLEVDLDLGRHAELVGELEALAASHPHRERLRKQLMLALYRSGRQAEALAVYRSTRRVLVEELGLEPSPALRELEQAILLGDPSLEPALPRADGDRGQPAPPPAPCQLPPDVDDFTGREGALAKVEQALERDQTTAIVICAITGKAGVGKTAIAVRVAHRLRRRFPDGQLYVNLRGAEARPLDPADVLAEFLRALGLAGTEIAEDPEERVRQFRARLADRRVLVVLDNAASEAQVRPLLPGSQGCAALVTSRARLSGLEAAHPLSLDVLDPDQAVELLARVAGPERVAAEPEMAREIVRLCGSLPLAVRIAGARLGSRPHWRLALLAERLADERRRLDELKTGDLEVRTSVALSYQGRGADERRLFRLLGLVAAPSFPTWVAAALLGTALAEAEDLLERLVDAELVEAAGEDQAGQLRYRLHDLLRIFARERLHGEEAAPVPRASLERVVRAYLSLAGRADTLLVPSGLDRYGGDPAGQDGADHPAVAIVERDPLRWFEAERASLVAAVEQACGAGLWAPACQLATTLGGYFQLGAYWDDWEHTDTLALTAAGRAGGRDEEARVLASLGDLYAYRHRFEDARDCVERSRAAFRETGNRLGEAQCLLSLSILDQRHGRLDDCVARAEENLATVREFGWRGGEAQALYRLGEVHREQGRFDTAIAYLEQSLALMRSIPDLPWEAPILWSIGLAHSRQGRFDTAIAYLEQSLAMAKVGGDRHGEAYVLEGMGDTYRRLGSLDQAAGCLERSRALARAAGDRGAEAFALHTLGQVRREQGRLDEATEYLEASLTTFQEIGYRLWEARARDSLGLLLADKGDWPAARSAWRAALAVFREAGLPEAAQVAARLGPGSEPDADLVPARPGPASPEPVGPEPP